MDRVFVSGRIALDSINGIKEESMHGRKYSVIPAVMMVEGAYYPNVSGSDAPEALFFSQETMKESVGSWNGRPVSLNHPKHNLSCNSPEVFKKQWLGYIFDAQFSVRKKRLTCNMWLDSEIAGDIIENVRKGSSIDVSIGAFGDILSEDGVFEGSPYNKKIENIVGDHLAVLPDSKGACSWKDGCGIRAEKAKDNKTIKEVVIMEEKKELIKVDRKENKCDDSNVEPAKPEEKVSLSSFIDNAPKEIRDMLIDQKETYLSLKNSLITNILEFENVKFDEEFLSGLKRCQLQKLSDLVEVARAKDVPVKSVKANYGINASAASSESTGYVMPIPIDWSV